MRRMCIDSLFPHGGEGWGEGAAANFGASVVVWLRGSPHPNLPRHGLQAVPATAGHPCAGTDVDSRLRLTASGRGGNTSACRCIAA